MIKDMRTGECWLKDNGLRVPQYEIIGSRLRAVCISDINEVTDVEDAESEDMPPTTEPEIDDPKSEEEDLGRGSKTSDVLPYLEVEDK